jgi:hypothetical protein
VIGGMLEDSWMVARSRQPRSGANPSFLPASDFAVVLQLVPVIVLQLVLLLRQAAD